MYLLSANIFKALANEYDPCHIIIYNIMKIIFVSIVLLITFITESFEENIPNPVEVKLISDNSGFLKSNSFSVGVLFKIKPGWHIYWKYPGDSGLPTEIKYTFQDDSVIIEDTQYPIPDMYSREGNITDYGYENEVLLTNKIRIPENYVKQFVKLNADIYWVACKEICIPGKTKSVIRINFSDKISGINSVIFAKWDGKYPSVISQKDLPFSYVVDKKYNKKDSVDVMRIKLDWHNKVKDVRIYPIPDRNLSIDKADIVHNDKISDYMFYPRLYGTHQDDIKELNFLISYVNSDNKQIGIETKLKLQKNI